MVLHVNTVHDYVAAGLDGNIVDPDGGVHTGHLRAESKKIPPIPGELPSNEWCPI